MQERIYIMDDQVQICEYSRSAGMEIRQSIQCNLVLARKRSGSVGVLLVLSLRSGFKLDST